LQAIVVFPSIFLEVPADVEQRLRQPVPADEEEHDEQSPEPAVSVIKGMDRFELIMKEGALDQRGDRWCIIRVSLPVAKKGCQELDRGRHKGGCVRAVAG